MVWGEAQGAGEQEPDANGQILELSSKSTKEFWRVVSMGKTEGRTVGSVKIVTESNNYPNHSECHFTLSRMAVIEKDAP